MFCIQCGAKAGDGVRFCNKCGTRVDTEKTQSFGNPQSPLDAQLDKGKIMAIVSLVLGITAMLLPVAVIDVILGIAGIVLAVMAKKEGFTGGVQLAGFICSIVGTTLAFFYTIYILY